MPSTGIYCDYCFGSDPMSYVNGRGGTGASGKKNSVRFTSFEVSPSSIQTLLIPFRPA